jgi:chromosome partitioning protein
MAKLNAFTIKRALQLFDRELTRGAIVAAEKSGAIPTPERIKTGSTYTRVWTTANLPRFGERYGFLPKLREPTCLTIFSSKGGVFKSTLALNIARMAALHNIRTCVVGLDLQADVSTALGFEVDLEDKTIEEALAVIRATPGLGHVLRGVPLGEVIQPTDIPTLHLLPETGDLVAVDLNLTSVNLREHVLKNRIIEPLKRDFDLVIIDCPPSWSNLISNAIVACDILLSPLECKIAQFKSLHNFQLLIDGFKRDLNITEQPHVFVPTRFSPSRRVSGEIRRWYLENIPNVMTSVVRDSVHGEAAFAERVSLPEYQPTGLLADEMRGILRELWTFFEAARTGEASRAMSA